MEMERSDTEAGEDGADRASGTCSQYLCWWTVPLSDSQGGLKLRCTVGKQHPAVFGSYNQKVNCFTIHHSQLDGSNHQRSLNLSLPDTRGLTCKGHTSCVEVEAPCTDACTLLTRWLCARSPRHSYSSLEVELNLFSAAIFQGPYLEDSKAAWLTNRAIVKGTKYKIRETKKKKFPAWED